MKRYELMPTGNQNQKSFNSKAIVEIDDNGVETLYSYLTPIIKRLPDGTLIRLWDSYSATTGKHIKAFCGLDKKQFEALKVGTEVEKIYSIPVMWEVWDKVEVKATSLRNAIQYVKDNMDIIPLGTEPEYIDGTYHVDDGLNGNATIDETERYIKEYFPENI